ncbi:WD40 repeat-like protein [Thermothelomyces heterothallicus CBS 203.75]
MARNRADITPLPPFQPDLYQRAWCSVPHPTLPLLATAHAKSVTVFSLATFSKHSALTGGHARSVRAVAWQPPRGRAAPKRLGLVTGSFDATAGLWSYDAERGSGGLEREIKLRGEDDDDNEEEEGEEGDKEEWEFNLVLEGHENEIKSLAFSPGGQYLATSSRDKSVWIWEDVSGQDEEEEDEWETVAVLNEHDGDVKAVAWAPSHLPNARAGVRRRHYSADVLASASYDDTVRIWREDADGEWVCVAVLEGHDGTVWGLQWEGKERADGRFPRLMTFSADGLIKVWTLRADDDEEEEEKEEAAEQQDGNPFKSGFGGVPNTMRRSLREEWDCTAVLPKVHTRDVYSVSWSAETGLVASTGSDGVIAVYAEEQEAAEEEKETTPTEDVAKGGGARNNGTPVPKSNWKVLGTVSKAHGPYEINHITWCKRFDPGAECKGKEEMLVTTGDDGVVRPWQVRIS